MTVHVPGTGQLVALMTPQKPRPAGNAALVMPAGLQVTVPSVMVASSPALYRMEMSVFNMSVWVIKVPSETNECLRPLALV